MIRINLIIGENSKSTKVKQYNYLVPPCVKKNKLNLQKKHVILIHL